MKDVVLHTSLCHDLPLWRHQMETFSALLALCEASLTVSGELPSQRPVTWSFDVFFDLRLNKWLSKQSRHMWFETPSRPLWRHCNIRTVWYIYSHQLHIVLTHLRGLCARSVYQGQEQVSVECLPRLWSEAFSSLQKKTCIYWLKCGYWCPDDDHGSSFIQLMAQWQSGRHVLRFKLRIIW